MRLLTDVNFNGYVIRALLRRHPDLDLVRAVDEGLGQTPDPELLQWAAEHDRIVVTHDVTTMVGHAYDRVDAGEAMPGVIEVPEKMPVGRVIDDLTMLIGASLPGEWNG
jgi:Domain of unknown function (DUF5615)